MTLSIEIYLSNNNVFFYDLDWDVRGLEMMANYQNLEH